jgi:O-antigen biosynthesis protein
MLTAHGDKLDQTDLAGHGDWRKASLRVSADRDKNWLMDAVPNELITSQQPHHQVLEILAAKALAGRDFVAAFKFADRRCRIDPPPLAHSYVLRAEAAYNIGDRPAALADLTSALKISPHDAAATRRLFAWASGPERDSAALSLIARDQDIATLHTAIEVLALVGKRRLAAVSVFDGYVAGWAAWDHDDAAELAIVSEDGALISLLAPDPFHPLSSHSVRATAFRIPRPASHAPQMVSISLLGETFFSQRMAPNSQNKVTDPATIHPRPAVSSDQLPTVIIPVYADFIATKACLESLLAERQVGKSYRIMIVNDASPEKELSKYITALSKHQHVTILTNPINLGFVGSVNRALSRLRGGDVVLLNADTVVPPGFVDRLKATAMLSDDIGTVVPLSNNSEISDFPNPNKNNPLGSRNDVMLFDHIAAKSNKAVAVDIPNGTGFCLYITRACLNAVGGLSESFQRGYLEDIDLCLRARERRFRNVCAPSVYVGHAGSRSFKSEKRSLVLRNLGILDRRFPRFRSECAAFMASDPLRPAREAIERQLPLAEDRPVLILTGAGALRAITQERANQLLADGHTTIVLEIISQHGQLRMSFSAANQAAPQSLSFGLLTPNDLCDLRTYLSILRPSHCEIVDPAMMPSFLTQTFAEMDIPFDVWVADGNSIDSEAAHARQRRATSLPNRDSNQETATEDPQTATPHHKTISAARRILVPCAMAEAFTKHTLQGRKSQLLAQSINSLSLPLHQDQPAKLLAIVPTRSSAKEFLAIRSLALSLRRRDSNVSILVAGSTFDDVRLMSHENVFVTGPTDASELGGTLQVHNVGWMLTGFDGPLFGHPLIQSVRKADIPVAYLDWSMGEITPRARDLALQPDVPLEQFTNQIIAWIEGT